MLETIVSIYVGGVIVAFVLLIQLAGNKSTSNDLLIGALIWPFTLFLGIKHWISK